mmetsp:Transcript_25578/g.89138  ORF Transcript_25578/g.89138 Transcript_25578/m.89138 type:complete len:231 (+) Transcript_25578:793-1485(+)
MAVEAAAGSGMQGNGQIPYSTRTPEAFSMLDDARARARAARHATERPRRGRPASPPPYNAPSRACIASSSGSSSSSFAAAGSAPPAPPAATLSGPALPAGASARPVTLPIVISAMMRSTSASPSSSTSSPSSSSMASLITSSMMPAFSISMAICRIAAPTAGALMSLPIIDITSALLPMAPAIFTMLIWFVSCIATEWICALDTCMRSIAPRVRTTSFASVLSAPMCPFL